TLGMRDYRTTARKRMLLSGSPAHGAGSDSRIVPPVGQVVQEFAPFFQESVAGHDGGTVLVAAHDQTTTLDQRFGCFFSSLVRVTNSLAAASALNCPWMVARFFTASSAFGTYGFAETGSVMVVVLFVGSPAIMVSSSF